MGISIVSKEVVRPSSLDVHLLKPFKISLLDQLTPTTFSPLILFYPMRNTHLKGTQISTQLKESLSKTLDPLYPFAARVRENLIINDYDEGVPYIETRVNTHLFEFLQNPPMELLDQCLPYAPFSYQPNPDQVPHAAVQLNTFDCGGIALGLCLSHKFIDGATASGFLRNGLQILVELAMKQEAKSKTRRFVFDAKAIASLRSECKGERVPNPTRIEALSAFILKSAMLASRSTANSRFVLHQAVNLRRLTEPRLLTYTVGNLFLFASAAYNMEHAAEMWLHELVARMKQAVGSINREYLKTLHGDESFPKVCEYIKQIEEVSTHKNLNAIISSSWLEFGFNEVDFGWGNPIWSGISGEFGSFRNVTIFKEIGSAD
ncbi:HXXXD-type acyl-transferase family protein [Citrus sinensis]|uniref:HXXXD-type acyl-transferase family protein n=1 Tax=Citrus sinensis TaxID=2711 RepID=A0ACB8IJ06_CITSI|nr:HXXXD-type acyl-transferase family protein [Citrus sinensis]